MDTKYKRVIICADTKDIEGEVSTRFARCQYYVLYDFNTKQFTYYENTAKEEMSGAGGRAAKIVADLDAQAILVPEVGPKAFDALDAFEIDIFRYQKGHTVKNAIYDFYEKKLTQISGPTTKGKH